MSENSFVEYDNNNSFKLIFNINSGKKFTFNELNLILSYPSYQKYFNESKLLSEYTVQLILSVKLKKS